MNLKCFATSAALLFLSVQWAFVTKAQAGPILQPSSVSTTAVQFLPIGQTIDQSGLNDGINFVNYVSGVTDFDTFVAATGHNNATTTLWLSDLAFPKVVTFDLGAPFAIDGFVLWNALSTSSANAFDVFSDSDGDFGNGAAFLMSGAAPALSGVPTVVTFSAVTTRFAHVRINTDHGSGPDLVVGEFAFRQVPEPVSLALLGAGGLLLLLARARRRRVQSC